MDQPKELRETEPAKSVKTRREVLEARRRLPKEVRRLLAEIDEQCGPGGEIYGHRD